MQHYYPAENEHIPVPCLVYIVSRREYARVTANNLNGGMLGVQLIKTGELITVHRSDIMIAVK